MFIAYLAVICAGLGVLLVLALRHV